MTARLEYGKGTTGRALIIANRGRCAPRDAAYINAAYAMALDYDDYLLAGHTGYSALLVPLAYATELDQVVLAAICANEVMGRLSLACLIGPLNGQMSSYIHNIGAATALGKIVGLSAPKLANAMALSLYQPNFCLVPGFWQEDSKTLTACQPMDLGIQAALFAAHGLNGPTDLLDDPLGFLDRFAFQRSAGIFDGLGQVWLSDTLCYKRYPGTSYISASVEAALALSGGRPISPQDLKRVDVSTTILSSTLDTLGSAALQRTPMDANGVNFSLRLSMALALLTGELKPSSFEPNRLAAIESGLRSAASKIRVIHSWEQTIRMFTASPLGLALYLHLGPSAWVKLVSHTRRMNRAAEGSHRSPSSFKHVLGQLRPFIGQMVRARRMPLSLSHFDAERFEMRQSAEVTLHTTSATSDQRVEIPLGACGRDPSETRRMIQWRCRDAFGPRGEAVFEHAMRGGSTVEQFYQAISGG
jgi:2-methylcitrate dehydratase